MRKAADTTNTPQQPATKRSKPTRQAQEPAAHRPATWQQLSFNLDAPTAQELWSNDGNSQMGNGSQLLPI